MAGESQAVPRSVPDPTVLTTEQLLRETTSLKDLLESKILAVDAVYAEKFRSVNEQLALIERQRVEQKADTKAAVDAALTAQKEAVKEQTAATDKAIAKTEASTAEQLKQQSVTSATSVAGVLLSLSDLKDRVVKIESVKLGGEQSLDRAWGYLVAVAGVAVAIAALVTR